MNKPHDVILVDRGLLDRLFWNVFTYNKKGITAEEKKSRDAFITNDWMPLKSDLLMVFRIPSEESIKRKGGEGKFVTKANVELYNRSLDEFLATISSYTDTDTKVETISTLGISKDEVSEKTFNIILDTLNSRNK